MACPLVPASAHVAAASIGGGCAVQGAGVPPLPDQPDSGPLDSGPLDSGHVRPTASGVRSWLRVLSELVHVIGPPQSSGSSTEWCSKGM